MLRPVVLLLLIAAASLLHSAHPRGLPGRRETTGPGRAIVILAGQSNMSGRGGVWNNTWDHVVPPECQPSPSIRRFSASLQWEEAMEPLHHDIDIYAVTGVGPGMSFANGVLGRWPAAQIGLVPCAVGATTIDQWSKGQEFYEKMIERARAGFGTAGPGAWVAGVLWYQGESNTINPGDAATYTTKMEKMVSDIRADLGLPNLLLVQVALASGQGPYLEPIRQAQKAVNMPNVVTVDAKGLQLSHDYVHLTTPAQVQLGKMLADAFLNAFH